MIPEQAPKRIFLQIDDDAANWDDTSWCDEPINGGDVEYIRADLAAPTKLGPLPPHLLPFTDQTCWQQRDDLVREVLGLLEKIKALEASIKQVAEARDIHFRKVQELEAANSRMAEGLRGWCEAFQALIPEEAKAREEAKLRALDDIKHLLADIRSNVKLDEGLSYRVEDAISILETGYSAFHRLPEPIEDAPALGVEGALYRMFVAGMVTSDSQALGNWSGVEIERAFREALAMEVHPKEARDMGDTCAHCSRRRRAHGDGGPA